MLFDHTPYAEKLPRKHVDGAWNEITTWKQRQYMSSGSFSKQVKGVRLNFILEFTLEKFLSEFNFHSYRQNMKHCSYKVGFDLKLLQEVSFRNNWHTAYYTYYANIKILYVKLYITAST
jgi:hypothetical protein